MGQSNAVYLPEEPVPGFGATLYYFAGRGLADQVRWMLAAAEISFTQKIIDKKSKIVKMAERQLPFGQLPLLQIDGFELVQSQAIVRFIAKKANLLGSCQDDEIRCDMIAEAVRDLVQLATAAPFQRLKGEDTGTAHIALMKEKWSVMGVRFEEILNANNKEYMVGTSLTYADILVVHIMTWFVEECGPEIMETMPLLVTLQHKVMSLPGVNSFIRSEYYYPIGDEKYCKKVMAILGRKI